MKCDFCVKDFEEKAKQGVTYEGIDEHHNPPSFMFEDDEIWEGELYNLCRNHHRKLHDKIIKILNEEAKTLKFIKSEHWVWVKMSLNQRKKARERVYKFTKNWIKEKKGEDDTENTSK